MSWILTYTGVKFDLLAPTPEMVRAEDIAIALSRQARFNGHTRSFYSVAQHSVLVGRQCKLHRREGLLHDAAEAYIGDMVRPLKALIPLFESIEHRIMRAVEKRFDLARGCDEVKYFDSALLATERRDLMIDSPDPWPGIPAPIDDLKIVPMPCGTAYALFCHEFADLFGWHPKSWDALQSEREKEQLVLACERV